MGLLIDRTVPIRIIGQMDPETGEVAVSYCSENYKILYT